MRAFLSTVVLSIIVALVIGVHVYLSDRLIIAPGWGGSAWRLWSCVVGVTVMLAALLAERLATPPWTRICTIPGYVWMGVAWFALAATGISDLVLWLGGWETTSALSIRASAVWSVVIATTGYGMRRALSPPPLKRVEITLDRWPAELDGYRIVQLTDLHIGPIFDRRWLQALVERANALAPDLTVVTGDLIDGMASRVGPHLEPLLGLNAPDGVFVITGNHEMFNGVRSWVRYYKEDMGLRLLENEHVTIARPEGSYELLGTHDRSGWAFQHPEDIDAAVAGCDPERPWILLAHDPLSFKKAAQHNIDLQLSGHTHGGQIWPFHILVRLVIPFVAGHYELNGSALYVSRGCGFWGPPMRVAAPPELTEITLRAKGVTVLNSD